jgi:molybdopterin molybdotransferase
VISYEEALELVLAAVEPVGTEDVPVGSAAGRVLARDVLAMRDSPPFNKAAVDGFAVRSTDVGTLPTELEVIGAVATGEMPGFQVGSGQAARVMTGGPIPAGADMVVMIEHTEQLANGRVLVRQTSGTNVCLRGEDMRSGTVALRAGVRLGPLHVGVAATAGAANVSVYRRPRVALVCTGNEVVEAGSTISGGKIFNSNGPILSALLKPDAAEFVYLGIVSDDRNVLGTALARGLDADLLVVTGGVSAGDYDLVPPVLLSLGVQQVFHKCAIKPGMPTFFGRHGRTIIFGMPGNPFSCFVIYHVLVRPALAKMVGAADCAPCSAQGILTEGFKNKPGRRHFIPAVAEITGGKCLLRRTRSHGSADIVGAADANALISLPPECDGVREGDTVSFLWL